MLKLDNVSSSYGESKVIKNVSLEISSGRFFGILGKNGMGKTTLLKTIMGLMHKDYNVHGFQFHPESISTKVGMTLIKNFISS